MQRPPLKLGPRGVSQMLRVKLLGEPRSGWAFPDRQAEGWWVFSLWCRVTWILARPLGQCPRLEPKLFVGTLHTEARHLEWVPISESTQASRPAET